MSPVGLLNACGDAWLTYVWHTTWQGTLVTAGALAIVFLGRRLPSPLKYGLLLIALLKFAVPPMLAIPTGVFSYIAIQDERGPGEPSTASAAFPGSPEDVDPSTSGGGGLLAALDVESDSDTPAGAAVGADASMAAASLVARAVAEVRWPAWLMLAHFLGTATFAGCFVKHWLGLHRLISRAAPVQCGPLFERYRSSAAQIGLARLPQLRVSDDPITPVACGVFRGVVIVPRSLVIGLNAADLRTVLGHELAHHRRRDPLMCALQCALLFVWWFNPLYWLLNSTLRHVREECCDDLVLARRLSTGADYCGALLHAGRRIAAASQRMQLHFDLTSNMHPVGRRMQRIMDARVPRRPKMSAPGLGAVVVLGLVLLPGIRGRADEHEINRIAAMPERADLAARDGRVVQRFDVDPAWEKFGQLAVNPPIKRTLQAFGWQPTNRAMGAAAGEIGGIITRSMTQAWYAKAIPIRTLEDRLSFSGRFTLPRTSDGSGVMFGFFNDENSRGWRTPNSLVMRISADDKPPHGQHARVFFEYRTKGWNGGSAATFEGDYASSTTPPLKAGPTPHEFSLVYDPGGAAGRGQITFTLDGHVFVTLLGDGLKAEGAEFNRFGIMNLQADGNALEVFFDDVTLDGQPQDFARDPGWDARGNRAVFDDRDVRSHHNLRWSDTALAGGMTGELAVTMWRHEQPAYIAAPVGQLTLDDELYAEGRLAFTGTGTDSGVCLGWFNAQSKQAADPGSPPLYLAIRMEGPGRNGHAVRPAYSTPRGEVQGDERDAAPTVRADGRPHRWSLHYDPDGARRGNGRITITLDDQRIAIDVTPEHRASGATFDRFGFFNIQSVGRHVQMYLDDVVYTASRTRR